jgi:Skp family chaperone for outer membrane proteins
MKSTRLIAAALMTLSLTSAVPAFSNETTPKVPTSATIPTPEQQQMLNRLEEIKAMDVKSLPRSERRALRKEVKEIDQKLQQNGGYIYISVGALLIVILLLILLL